MPNQQIRVLTVQEKALEINLDRGFYGTLAEIGGGQETANAFFKAGGASGTVAKSMSAYDMAFSDAIYGKTQRYVCEERLGRMLDHEYELLPERLESRRDNTRFFAFANTVETLNYKKTNQGHGWLGCRFQLRPDTPPNDCIIHVNLHDNDAVWQQEALGVIGVNLIYACYKHHEHPEQILLSLMDHLSQDRIEVDMFRLSGPDFEQVDNRLMSLMLVRNGMTNVAMFGPTGEVLQPSDALYKKNIMILRGRFRPVTHIHVDMLRAGVEQFLKDPDVKADDLLVVSELTMSNLAADGGMIHDRDFLDRVDLLCSMGQTVMLSNYDKYYKLVASLSRHVRKKKIGIVLGIPNLANVFDERYYTELTGGILECFGILFGNNVKMMVYPSYNDYTGLVYKCEDFGRDLKDHLRTLFLYMFRNRKIEDLHGAHTDLLYISSDTVLEKIRKGDAVWEEMVPLSVAEVIKARGLFGYLPAVNQEA